MKKLIFLLTCLCFIFSLTAICCFAAEENADETDNLTAESINEGEGDNSSNGDLSDTGDDLTENDSKNNTSPSEDAEGNNSASDEDLTNPFEALYYAALEHSGEIFSALACLFSAILMLCYRKGIMPLIEGGIGAISGSVSTISREAERQSTLSDSTKQIIEQKLSGAEALLDKISASFEDFDARLKTCEGLKSFELSVRGILLSQIDLLYEVFMNSSLPQYEKDRIGEMVSVMKKNASEEREPA